MARNREALNRILRRGEDACLLVSTATLMLVEVGYVAWLERMPRFPARHIRPGLSICRLGMSVPESK